MSQSAPSHPAVCSLHLRCLKRCVRTTAMWLGTAPTMVAGPNKTLEPGTFQVALGEEAAGLPKDTPSFGIMLDGLEKLRNGDRPS